MPCLFSPIPRRFPSIARVRPDGPVRLQGDRRDEADDARLVCMRRTPARGGANAHGGRRCAGRAARFVFLLLTRSIPRRSPPIMPGMKISKTRGLPACYPRPKLCRVPAARQRQCPREGDPPAREAGLSRARARRYRDLGSKGERPEPRQRAFASGAQIVSTDYKPETQCVCWPSSGCRVAVRCVAIDQRAQGVQAEALADTRRTRSRAPTARSGRDPPGSAPRRNTVTASSNRGVSVRVQIPGAASRQFARQANLLGFALWRTRPLWL